eukprot:a177202_111.p1 GENE.a177202_111~~a177202_111.p1  ORF type:complete len:678 (-),score=280.97 a177202_111:18-1865(-)
MGGAARFEIEPCPQPLDLTFKDLRYSTTGFDGKPLEILKGISGRIPAGTMVAILGASGAGKSTFLKVLGGRLQATQGTIVLGNRVATPASKRKIGYVLQEDHLLSEQTVRETLEFAALMRLPREMPKAEKLARVERLLVSFGLLKCANTHIGGVSFAGFTPGISGGEKKRVSVANEFLFDPAMLMLDEPTSGLDSATAYTIISELKSLTASGRSVVTTIHQPSSSIFNMFDLVILLDAGRVCYLGPVQRVVDHFTRIGLTPPLHYNVADYMLDLSTSPTLRNRVDLPEAYAAAAVAVHPPMAEIDAVIASAIADAPSGAAASGPAIEQRKFETTFLTQLALLTKRAFKQQRGDTWTKLNICQYSAITIVLSLIWWQIPRDAQSINDRVGLLFFLLLYFSFDPVFHSVTTIPSERSVFTKERQAGAYRLSAYFMSKGLADIPIALAFPLAIMVFVYFTTTAASAYAADKFFIYLLILLLQVLTAQSIGLLVSACIMNLKRAMVTVGLVILSMTLLGGFYRNGGAIPIWLNWIRWVSIITYGNQALIQNDFSNTLVPCKGGVPDGTPFSSCPVSLDDIRAFYAIKISLWGNIGIQALTAVAMRTLAFFALKFNKSTK